MRKKCGSQEQDYDPAADELLFQPQEGLLFRFSTSSLAVVTSLLKGLLSAVGIYVFFSLFLTFVPALVCSIYVGYSTFWVQGTKVLAGLVKEVRSKLALAAKTSLMLGTKKSSSESNIKIDKKIFTGKERELAAKTEEVSPYIDSLFNYPSELFDCPSRLSVDEFKEADEKSDLTGIDKTQQLQVPTLTVS